MNARTQQHPRTTLQEAVDNRIFTILRSYDLTILLAAAGGRRQGRGPSVPGERLRRAVHSEDAELALRTGRRRANERMSGVNVDVKDKKGDWGFPTSYTTCAMG